MVDFLDKIIQAVKKLINREIIGEKREVYGKPCIFADFQEFHILYKENSIK